MGIFGKLADAWNALWGKSSSSGGRTSTSNTNTTVNEPDKVRVAEIEADLKIQLSRMDNERIGLIKDAEADLIEFRLKSDLMLEEARIKGQDYIVRSIIHMQEKVNEIAKQRFIIISECALPIVKEMEIFYFNLGEKIDKNRDEYNGEKLPQLLEILNKYPIDSPAHKLYSKQIENDMDLHNQWILKQLDGLLARQEQMMKNINNAQNQILEQANQIPQNIFDSIGTSKNEEALQLDEKSPIGALLTDGSSAAQQ